MKKNSYFIFLIGLLIIVCFKTPLRDAANSNAIRHGSIFSDGFIEYSRLFLYALVWALFSGGFGERNIFDFLKQDNTKLFFSRFLSRVIDSTILAIFVSIAMMIFGSISKSEILTYFIFMPVVSFVFWLIYFIIPFDEFRTFGDKLLRIETKTDLGEAPRFMQITMSEIIYSLPLFLYAIAVGILNYIDENGNDGVKDKYIDHTYPLVAILVVAYTLFPLTTMFNKKGIGLIDKWTKLRVNRTNAT